MKNVKAIIMAAGKGTRMKSDVPKVLHKIYEKPLLGRILETVKKTGTISSSIVVVGHQAEIVAKFVEESHQDAKCVLQSPQLGTGDAVSKAIPELQGFDGQIVILSGDVPLITAETINKFIENHTSTGSKLSVMSCIFETPGTLGRIIRNEDGTIKEIVEAKDATEAQLQVKEINTGIYCLDWKAISPALSELKCNNAQGEYYLTDIVKWAIGKDFKVTSFVLENQEESLGINSKEDLALVTTLLTERVLKGYMANGVEIIDPKTTYISPETEIKPGTTILPCTYITGENKIGENCKIGPFAHLRGGVILGDNVKVGNFVELKKSTVASNTNISHLSYVGDSDVGKNVNIGAGTITANYNAITKEKSNTIIKDNASIGSNSVLVAPVIVEEYSQVAAGTVLTKNTTPYSLAITRSPLKLLSDWVKSKIK